MVKKMTKNLIKNKINGNKKAVLSISLILLLAMTVMMAFAQTGLAQIGVAQPEKTVGLHQRCTNTYRSRPNINCKPMGLSSTYNL